MRRSTLLLLPYCLAQSASPLPKNMAVNSQDVYWVATLDIPPGHMEEFIACSTAAFVCIIGAHASVYPVAINGSYHVAIAYGCIRRRNQSLSGGGRCKV